MCFWSTSNMPRSVILASPRRWAQITIITRCVRSQVYNLFKSENSPNSVQRVWCFTCAGTHRREMAFKVVCTWVHPVSQILKQKWRLELWHYHVGGLHLWRKTLQGKHMLRRGQHELLVWYWILTFCAENERPRSNEFYRKWKSHGMPTWMPRHHVWTDERLLDIQVNIQF